MEILIDLVATIFIVEGLYGVIYSYCVHFFLNNVMSNIIRETSFTRSYASVICCIYLTISGCIS